MTPLPPLHQALIAVIAFAMPFSLPAQQPAHLLDAPVSAADSSNPPSTTTVQSPAKPPTPLTARWLDLTTFTHSQRYRNQYGDDGYHYFEDGQQRSVVAGKFKFDRQGKVSLGFRASSGRTFNWAYADYAGPGFAERLNNPAIDADYQDPATDPAEAAAYAADPAGVAFVEGIDSAGWDFYPRELYLSVAPVKQATFEFGSFGIEKGYSSEITSFDDDGYIAGERVKLNDPRHLYFDQITLTSAYFGQFETTNLLGRGDSFSKSNYRQIAAKKQLNPRLGISGEYNWISQNARTHTLREAVTVDTHESKLFDKVRVEAYERLNLVYLQGDDENPRQGFAITGEKKVGKLSGDFGFVSVDRDYGLYSGSSFEQEVGFSLNGDNYNTGIRVFSHLNYKINSVITAFGFYTRITGENIPNLDTQGLNAGMSFDLKALINSEKLVF